VKLKDYFRLGWDQLKRRKVVTSLCALGIAIGSASIIVALSFGESITHYSEQQMNQWFKMDELTVSSGYSPPEDGQAEGTSVEVTLPMLELIRTIPGVQAAAPFEQIDHVSFVVDESKNGYVSLIATELPALPDFGYELRQGAITDIDNVIILNYAATLDIFDERTLALSQMQRRNNGQASEQEPISYPVYQKTIELQKEIQVGDGSIKTLKFPLRVIGVMARPEGLPPSMIHNPKIAYISLKTANHFQNEIAAAGGLATSMDNRPIQETRVKVNDTKLIPQIEETIRKLKLNVYSNLYQQERMSEELMIVRLVFGGAGLFILLVASLTIVVAMTMATHQRRRQIGIMKVLGATLGQIRNMFIFEATLLGILGGLLGALLSHWVIWGINAVVIKLSGDGSNSEILFISYWVLPIGMLFAILTGVLSGLYPAISASRTDALTAIKRE